MKEFIIMLIIIIIIFGGSIYVKNYLNKTCGELSGNLEELRQKIVEAKQTGENKEVLKMAEEVEEKWNKTEKEWSIIVLHDELDLIETAFIRMRAEIEDGDLESATEELEVALFLVNHINEKEKFCLKNIF